MARYQLTARYKGKNNTEHLIQLALISFEEDGVYYVYSPALDLMGYGKTEKEAKKSFDITLEEFTRYTDNKNTLLKEFQKLGWVVKLKDNKIKSVTAPSYNEMLVKHKEFNKIVTKKAYRQTFAEIAI